MLRTPLRPLRLFAPALLVSGALAPLPAMEAQAQGISPAVDVCNGISVNRQSVRNLLGSYCSATIEPLRTRSNGLIADLGLTLLFPSLTFNPVTEATTAETANPITLDVLDTLGNPVLAGGCNLTADALTLNTQGGLAIGGTVVTGLGLNGLAATAGTTDSIALGNSATTGGLASGAVAIGTGASVTVANGIALGNASVADRAALAGYAAIGISGLSNSAGSVSVGAAGSLRQLTNLAPGSALTDAATVGQLQGVLDAATANTAAIAGNTAALVGFTTDVGTLTVDLAALDVRVTTNATDIAAVTGTVAGLSGDVAVLTADVGGLTTDLAALGTAVATNTGDIGTLTTNLAALGGQVAGNTGSIAT